MGKNKSMLTAEQKILYKALESERRRLTEIQLVKETRYQISLTRQRGLYLCKDYGTPELKKKIQALKCDSFELHKLKNTLVKLKKLTMEMESKHVLKTFYYPPIKASVPNNLSVKLPTLPGSKGKSRS